MTETFSVECADARAREAYRSGLRDALESVEIVGYFEGPPGLGEQGSWNERGNADCRVIKQLLDKASNG